MKSLQAAKVSEVKLSDPYLAPRMAGNYQTTIPSSIQKCRETGRIDAFKLDWQEGMPNKPHIFWDSDFAKVLEGMAYEVALHPEDQALARELDGYVDLVISAQQPDGYLNIVFTALQPENRWKNTFDCHELYCAGHLMEAAVAHFEATGNRKFLDCLCRYADYIATVFGTEPNQIHGYPGHEEIELGLCKLAKASGCDRYFRLAKYFVDERGKEPNHFLEEKKHFQTNAEPWNLINRQAHVPVRKQDKAVGHSVRAVYLYTGMADVAAQSNDQELLDVTIRIFDNMVERRMYITGGLGSTPMGEAFTEDFHLPNDTAYAESCASMGLVQLANRLANITGDGRFADEMERALYNGALSGISLKGDQFFYANLLEVDDNTFTHGVTLRRRQPWFDCSCCPTSYCRFLPQLGSFAWSFGPGIMRQNLPVAGRVEHDGFKLAIGGNYPYDGTIPMTVEQGGQMTLAIRIPGWCRNWSLSINGQSVAELPAKGFINLDREWHSGDQLLLQLELPVEVVRSHTKVTGNAGRIALMRGPLVYALESIDNGNNLSSLVIPADQKFELTTAEGLPQGTVAITGIALKEHDQANGRLYYCATPEYQDTRFVAIPYALWQNRGPASMAVWLRSC